MENEDSNMAVLSPRTPARPAPQGSAFSLSLLTLAIGLACAPGLAGAEDITYNGNLTELLYPINGNASSLGPSTTSLTDNNVTVDYSNPTASNTPNYIYGGYDFGIQDVTGNTVTLKNGTVTKDIYGGYAKDGGAGKNTVSISGGTVSQKVIGGFSNSSDATGNTVTISGGTVSNTVIGGYVNTLSGNATDNTVNISGGALGQNVRGGHSTSGNVSSNTVNISGGTLSNIVEGGSSVSGNASNNTVNISGGTLSQAVYGGQSTQSRSTGTATGNTVNISGGTVGNSVYGGNARLGDATGNTVTINGGTVSGDVNGGTSDSGNATGNTVNISGTANLSNTTLRGGQGGTGKDAVTNNTLNVNSAGMSAKGAANFAKYNFLLPADITANSTMLTTTTAVNNNNSTIGLAISGAPTKLKLSDSVTLLSKVTTPQPAGGTLTVTTDNGVDYTFSLGNKTTGSDISLIAMLSGIQTAGDYTLPDSPYNITAGENQDVSLAVGGKLTSPGNITVTSNASHSTTLNAGTLVAPSLTLTGEKTHAALGTVDMITASTALTLDGVTAANVSVSNLIFANGNSLTVTSNNSGSMTATGNLTVTGTGNHYTSPVAWNAAGKDLSFILPDDIAAHSTLLTMTSADVTDISSSLVRMGATNLTALKAGDAVTLLDASTGGLNATGINSTAEVMKGVSLLYKFNLTTDNNALIATLAGGGKPDGPPTLPDPSVVNPQTKSLSEGRLAGLAFANQGADMIVNSGISSAVAATRDAEPQSGATFSTVNSGNSRYHTGSHADVSGTSLLTGLAWSPPTDACSLLGGVFFETGNGSYSAYNSFSNAAAVNARGKTRYTGGGMLGRLDLPGVEGLYLDVSARAGHLHTDYGSSDFRSATGEEAHYTSGSTYMGGHAGLGYLLTLNPHHSLDFSTRYIATRQDGDNVDVAGDTIKFGEASSLRWRNGARYTYTLDERASWYAGAYYDHEFDGQQKATTYGRDMDAPSLKGGTGVGELGLIVRPVSVSGLSVNLGVQGYTGERAGFAGGAQVKWEM
ncbi:hypothetical protein [Buttiauxella ferragutiae]|uniref:hypothetical protein n=1 Tax=Buttiauxella ferragutiae TaxID=82989 RepID=UPI003523561C